MQVENVEELLDYIFSEKDYSENPDEVEYRKLQRIMVIMIRFYQRGSASKKEQLDRVKDDWSRLEEDEKMIHDQQVSIRKFASAHPKQNEYEQALNNELIELEKARYRLEPAIKKWQELYDWSLNIVDTVVWLGEQLKAYSNEMFKTSFDNIDNESKVLSVELFCIYKRGLDEITYNIQESQDFFDASLDGRLSKYHQIEKDIIEAQLEVIRHYPEDSPRRKAIEPDYLSDLDYVMKNMEMNPRVWNNRQRMREMHQEFFGLLKWQRRRILRLPFDFPHLLEGDVERLKEEVRRKENETVAEALDYRILPDDDQGSKKVEENLSQALNQCPISHDKTKNKGKGNISNEILEKICPMKSKGIKLEMSKQDEKITVGHNHPLKIHRLYD